MNERHFTCKLRQRLNCGLRDLSPGVLDRLSAAREAALVRQKRFAAHPALAAGGHLFLPGFRSLRFSQTFVVIAFLLSAFCSAAWIADRRVEELGSIESAILSDELPIAAFTDTGFARWLDSESAAE